jgi:glutaredoxin
MSKQLMVYITTWCPACRDAQAALAEWRVTARLVNIGREPEAASRVRALTGFESVPTFVAVEGAGFDPIEPPAPLPPGKSARGIDRGAVLTEPSRPQMREWLVKHGFLGG